MSDEAEEFDLQKLLAAIPQNPALDGPLEEMTPMLSMIAALYGKMVLTGIPPGLAERLVYDWMRGLFPTIFNHPTVTIFVPGAIQ